jgi:molybdopterin-guanine dinucleotide biosynthesis protein A
MGADKALIPLAGRPLVARSVDILHQAGLTACIAGARSPLGEFAPVVEDREADQGPLGGVCSALRAMEEGMFAKKMPRKGPSGMRWAVFLSVDLPLLPASLLACLLDRARITGVAATLASVNGYPQTFPAVVDRLALPALEAELKAGRGGCFAAFQVAAAKLGRPMAVCAVELLLQCGQIAHQGGLPAARWFLNVNAAGDLRRAEATLHGADRVI